MTFFPVEGLRGPSVACVTDQSANHQTQSFRRVAPNFGERQVSGFRSVPSNGKNEGAKLTTPSTAMNGS
jgi:hypothetical protein